MRCLSLLIAVLVLAAGPVVAGPFEDAGIAAARQDYATALRLWRPLAASGNSDAQVSLGMMYLKGQGVAKDDQQAVFWFRKAAEQGNASAQHNLGVAYDFGHAVPKNDQLALTWYRKAAEQGVSIAQFNLGVMYAKGRGVDKNEQQAYFWFLLASVGGDPEAIRNRELAETRVTPQQRAATQVDASNWKPK